MKRIVLFALMLCLALMCVNVSAESTTEIVFWHSASGEAGEILSVLIDEFNSGIGAEKGICVRAVYQGSYADSVNKMNSVLSADDADALPDVMQLDATGKVRYLTAETAYTAQEALSAHGDTDTDDFLPAALGNWRYEGVQLGLPFATSTTLTYYNASVIDEAPDTLEDIAEMRDSYDVADGIAIYACVPNTPTLANWIGQLGGYVVNSENGSQAAATELACAQDGTLLTFLSAWKELYLSGALVNRASSNDEFIAGRQLVMTGSSSLISSLKERIGGAFELGVAPYLRVNGDALAGASVNGSCLVMFDHGEARTEAAWELVKYLTSADAQARYAAKTGYLPARYSAMQTEIWQTLIGEEPEYAVGFAQLMNTPENMRSVTVGPSADFYYTIQDIVSDMLESDLSPEETCELMDAELSALLDRYTKANP